MKKVIEYYKKYPPNVLTPERALRRIAGYVYADGRNPFESNQLTFTNSNICYLLDFHKCINLLSKKTEYSVECHAIAIVKKGLMEIFKKDIERFKRNVVNNLKICEYSSISVRQTKACFMLIYKGSLAKYIIRRIRDLSFNLEIDGIATYLNGDGYTSIRGDKQGLLVCAKEEDKRIIKILSRSLRKTFNLRLFEVPMMNERVKRLSFSLCMLTAATLLVYGCDKMMKAYSWFLENNSRFRYIDNLPEVLSIRDPLIKTVFKNSARLRVLRKEGFLEILHPSKGNRPTIYRLGPLFRILKDALLITQGKEPKNAYLMNIEFLAKVL